MADFDDLDSLDDLGDLDSLDDLESLDDLDTLEDFTFDDPPLANDPASPAQLPATPVAPTAPTTAPPAAAPAVSSGLATVLQDLLAKGNHTQVLQIASSQKSTVVADPQLMAMVEVAQTKHEQSSFVKSFLAAAEQARAAGDMQAVAQQVEKARAIDSSHPDLVAFTTALAASASDGGLVPGTPVSGEGPAADAARGAQQRANASTRPMAAVALEPSVEPVIEMPAEAPLALDDDDLTFDIEGDDAQDATLSAGFSDDPSDELSFDLDASDNALGAADFGGDEADFGDDAASGDFAPAETLEPTLDTGLVEAPVFDDDPADESSNRIAQLLVDGQERFDAGDYQAAIDVWSRIFLIDIDHARASEKIEDARSKKAELEREAEELFQKALDDLEARDLEQAKAALARVLVLQPEHQTARDYLQQLESGQVPAVRRASGDDIPDLLDDGGLGDLSGPAEGDAPSMDAAVARDRVVVVKKTDRRLLTIAAAVAIAVIGGAALLITQWDSLFPNADDQAATTERKVDPIVSAKKIYEQGKIQPAIDVLSKVSLADPSYEEAQALMTTWKAQVAAPTGPVDTGPSNETKRRHAQLIRAGQDAFDAGHYIRSRKYLESASKLLPLGDEQELLNRKIEERLRRLQPAINKFSQGLYREILTDLWRQLESDPDNPDIQRLMVDSYYNLALNDLQLGKAASAEKLLNEAIEVQPENTQLKRLALFAKAYKEREKDLLYRIFVKYLPSRS